jgi:hypothetical protein
MFHPVEPDAASAPTIGMHGVDVPCPNNFRRHRQDQGRRPAGLGGRALGLWDRGEERGRPGTPWREGDAGGVAEPRSTARPEIQPPRRRVQRRWQIPGGADVPGDAANEITVRRLAVQVPAVQ